MHTRPALSLIVTSRPPPEEAVATRPLPVHLAFLRERSRPSLDGVLAFDDARLDSCFPHAGLPLGALHEIAAEGRGAETGELPAAFATALIGRICENARVPVPVLWVAVVADLYPPGLVGLDPARLVLVNPRDDAGVLAVMEIALREGGFAAVVGEVGGLDRVASRRLAFACQKHGVTAFVLRRWPFGKQARAQVGDVSAAATRWQLAPAPGGRWRVELAHVRGGRPGAWLMEVANGIEKNPIRVVAALADHPAAENHRGNTARAAFGHS